MYEKQNPVLNVDFEYFFNVFIWALALILTASCGPHVPTNKIIIKNLKTKITHVLSTHTMRFFI